MGQRQVKCRARAGQAQEQAEQGHSKGRDIARAGQGQGKGGAKIEKGQRKEGKCTGTAWEGCGRAEQKQCKGIFFTTQKGHEGKKRGSVAPNDPPMLRAC